MPQGKLRYLLVLKLEPAAKWSPDAGWEARLLGGRLGHITGTVSGIAIVSKEFGAAGQVPVCDIPAATGSKNLTLNPICVSSDYDPKTVSNSTSVWFDDTSYLSFNGAASSGVYVFLEVVKVDSKTGRHLA